MDISSRQSERATRRQQCILRLEKRSIRYECHAPQVLELTRALLEAVEAQDRQLSAHEAACILPCIVEKAGSNAVRRLADATLWCRDLCRTLPGMPPPVCWVQEHCLSCHCRKSTH